MASMANQQALANQQQTSTANLTLAQMLQLLNERNNQLAVAQEQLRAAMATQSQQPAEATPSVGHLEPRQPDLYKGQRDPAALKRWEHQMRTYIELQAVPVPQQVAMASTFLDGPALLWWVDKKETVANGTAVQYVSLDEFFQGVTNQFVPRQGWQVARDQLASLYQNETVC